MTKKTNTNPYDAINKAAAEADGGDDMDFLSEISDDMNDESEATSRVQRLEEGEDFRAAMIGQARELVTEMFEAWAMWNLEGDIDAALVSEENNRRFELAPYVWVETMIFYDGEYIFSIHFLSSDSSGGVTFKTYPVNHWLYVDAVEVAMAAASALEKALAEESDQHVH